MVSRQALVSLSPVVGGGAMKLSAPVLHPRQDWSVKPS